MRLLKVRFASDSDQIADIPDQVGFVPRGDIAHSLSLHGVVTRA